MPGGLDLDATQSYAAFAAVKLVGYSASTIIFNQRSPDTKANPVLFGITRTLLGMLLGAAVGIAGLVTLELAFWVFLFALVPFRLFEWFATLWLFFRKSVEFRNQVGGNVAIGTAISFGLDLPAAVGFLITGGLWIC